MESTTMNLTKYLELVKSLSAYLARSIDENTDPELEKSLFNKRLELKALAADLKMAEEKILEYEKPKELSARASNLVLTPEDLVGLPPELLNQLAISESDRQEFKVLDLIKERGGTTTLDFLIIDWYKATQEILERHKLSAKLYRMTQKGLIYPIPNKKGVYSLYPPDNQDVEQPENNGEKEE